jgi:hypothetical protein
VKRHVRGQERGDRESNPKTHIGIHPLTGDAANRSASRGLGVFEVCLAKALTCEGFLFFVFVVFFGMVRQQLQPSVRIRFSLLYPWSSGASSAAGRHAELCAQGIS